MTDLTQTDLRRLSTILETVDLKGFKILGRAYLEEGVLGMPFLTEEDALNAQRAFISYHMNTDIDPDSNEARIRRLETGVWLEIDVLEPLWREKENVPPVKVTRL